MSGPRYQEQSGDMNKDKLEIEAEAWWKYFKEKLGFTDEKTPSDLDRSRIGYYELDEKNKTIQRKLISGLDAPDPDGIKYKDSDVLDGSKEPSTAQMIELKRAMDEGRLFFFSPKGKTDGDKVYRVGQDEKGDLTWEKFDPLHYSPIELDELTELTEKPKEPKGVSFFDKVKSFFGNKAAREKVDNYKRDFAQYRNDKERWEKLYGKNPTSNDIKRQLTALLLTKGNRWKDDMKEVCKVYRANDSALKGKPKVQEETKNFLDNLPSDLEKIKEKYVNFDAKQVKNIKQLEELYKDVYDITDLLQDGRVRNSDIGTSYQVVATKLLGIIGDNKGTFKALEDEYKNTSEFVKICKMKKAIRSNVEKLGAIKSIDKAKFINEAKNEVKKADEGSQLNNDNKPPQMGGMGGMGGI